MELVAQARTQRVGGSMERIGLVSLKGLVRGSRKDYPGPNGDGHEESSDGDECWSCEDDKN
jgi:hypothetical protein